MVKIARFAIVDKCIERVLDRNHLRLFLPRILAVFNLFPDFAGCLPAPRFCGFPVLFAEERARQPKSAPTFLRHSVARMFAIRCVSAVNFEAHARIPWDDRIAIKTLTALEVGRVAG